MQKGLAPGWTRIFDELRPQLEAALALYDPAACVPRPEHLFEAFRFCSPEDVRVIVLGQDPYPQRDADGGPRCEADGLAFSAPGHCLRTLPPSLRAVRAAAGLPAAPERRAGGDLRSWAAQGVLLVNTALAIEPGRIALHRKAWRPFLKGLLERTAEAACGDAPGSAPRKHVVAMLWGRQAQALAPDLLRGARRPAASGGRCLLHKQGQPDGVTNLTLLEWSHPSPLANNGLPPGRRFENCGHFGRANGLLQEARLRPVCWDPEARTVVGFDGGCAANGKAGAAAGFGVAAAGGALEGLRVAGAVQPLEYALEGELPWLSLRPVAGKPAAPSNNRGELLGGCWAMLAVLRSGVRGDVKLVTDSLLFKRTLEEWLPARRAKGTERGLKNFDLVSAAEALRAAVLERCAGLEMVHVRSHRKKPPAAPGSELWTEWKLNDEADRLAGRGIKGDATPLPPWLAGAELPAAP